MATLICNGTGNLTGITTFAAAEAGALSNVLNRNTIESLANNASVTSVTFTVTNAKVIDAVLLWVRQVATGSTGTFKVDLQKGGVSQASVTVNRADLPVVMPNGGSNAIGNLVPVLFKLSSTATGDGGANWTIVLTNSNGTNAVNYAAATNSTTNFTRALRTTTAATPAAADDLYIIGELTGAGTQTARTVTMNSTATTAYGNGLLNSTTVAGGGIHCGYYGTLSYGISASTNYVLRVNGDLWVWEQGPLNIGSSGSEIPRNSSAILEFQQASAAGDFGLRIMDNAIFNAAGLSRTVGKVINKCKLNANLSVAGTTLNVDTDTGWLNGDAVCLASTTRTASECESLTLSGNAGASSMTVGAAANAHSGTSPTQAEVGLLTRNVKIRSTSNTLSTYMYCTASAIVTVSWSEFQYLGTAATNKRGIDIDASVSGTAGAKSITYCSLRDFIALGITNQSGGNSWNVTFSNNVSYNNAANAAVTLAAGLTLTDYTFDNNLIVKSAAIGFTLTDVGGTITNNTVAGCTTGFSLLDATGPAVIGTFTGNVAHSNSGIGFSFTAAGQIGTLGITSWRNNNSGVSITTVQQDLTFNNATLFGNLTNNINYSGGGDYLGFTGTNVICGDTTFSTLHGININTNSLIQLDLSNIDMSGTGGIFSPHATDDILFANANLNFRALGNNLKFGAPTAITATKSAWNPRNYIGLERYNQTAGDHRTEMTYGQMKTDTTIFNTASPSMRMTPNNATSKLESAPKGMGLLAAVANGGSATISVYTRKSVVGDGAAYNGNQPRLIQRANAALGQTADVVLDTMVVAAGSFEQLIASGSVASDDGAFEYIVDCDGTAGWVNVDDWAAT